MDTSVLPFTSLRKQFPSLQRKHNNLPMVFLDGPAGTQVPQSVIEAISHYYSTSNANTHGAFITTRETDDVIQHMRRSMAALVGAEYEDTISIGQNMTSLNFALARAMSRILQPGDEVLITQLDHEANRGPWLTLTHFGINVKEVILKSDGVLDYDDFAGKINAKTKLVCMGMSSNCIGTVNNFKLVRKLTNQYNAWLLLDAVHYAPHFSIDVQSLGCDFLLCSAYKFYGPHVGILYSRPGSLELLNTERLIVQDDAAPYRIETGTLNHPAIEGVGAAVDYLARFGRGATRKETVRDAVAAIAVYEHELGGYLWSALEELPGVHLW